MKKLRLMAISLIVSITINLLCILPYWESYYERFREKIIPTQYFSLNSPDNEVIKAVLETSMKMKGNKFKTQQPNMGLIPDIKFFLTHREEEFQRSNNYAMAYLYAGLSYYALKNNDSKVMDYLILKSGEFSSSGRLNYKLTEVDQVPIGIMYINLYKISHNKDFFNVAHSIFEYLKHKRINGSNIITYR